MSEQEKISIIVPVFNAEKFLPETLEALCGQTWKNLEIILIDDASTDSSARICAEYAAKDPRLILIRKTIRQGQGAARLGLGEGDAVPPRQPAVQQLADRLAGQLGGVQLLFLQRAQGVLQLGGKVQVGHKAGQLLALAADDRGLVARRPGQGVPKMPGDVTVPHGVPPPCGYGRGKWDPHRRR